MLIDRADDYLEREFSIRFEGGLTNDMPATLYRFEGAHASSAVHADSCGRKRGGTMKDKRPTKRFEGAAAAFAGRSAAPRRC